MVKVPQQNLFEKKWLVSSPRRVGVGSFPADEGMIFPFFSLWRCILRRTMPQMLSSCNKDLIFIELRFDPGDLLWQDNCPYFKTSPALAIA